MSAGDPRDGDNEKPANFPRQCPECPRMLTSAFLLEGHYFAAHVRDDRASWRFHCPACDDSKAAAFIHRSGLARHWKRHHSALPQPIFEARYETKRAQDAR